jgi:hypothetical protein
MTFSPALKALVAGIVPFVAAIMLGVAPGQAAPADPAKPFANLPGRWVGQGRLGIKGDKAEMVKCRVTYLSGETADEIKQNIRCASAGGNVEVKSEIKHSGGALSGNWVETVYNLSGGISGQVTDNGFRVVVQGADMTANMDIIVRGDKQIIEIQFHNSTLLGLTLVLQKG